MLFPVTEIYFIFIVSVNKKQGWNKTSYVTRKKL